MEKIRLRVIAGLLANDRPKDRDITISIVSDSVVIRKQLVEGFTADPISRHPRNPKAEFEFTNDEFAALYGSGRAPLVRVVLDSQGIVPARAALGFGSDADACTAGILASSKEARR